MKRLPIRIRDDAEPVLRARCLRFLTEHGPKVRFEFMSGNNYWSSGASGSTISRRRRWSGSRSTR